MVICTLNKKDEGFKDVSKKQKKKKRGCKLKALAVGVGVVCLLGYALSRKF